MDGEGTPATATTSGSERAHHSTYASLVTVDTDMIGHVAYALYKRDKLRFCDAMSKKHSRPATKEEIQAFIDSSNVRLDSYRSEAEKLLEQFSEEVLRGVIDESIETQRKEYTRKLEAARPFWRAVLENFTANVAGLAVTALVVIVLYSSRVGLVPLLADIFGYQVQEKPAVGPVPPAKPSPPAR